MYTIPQLVCQARWNKLITQFAHIRNNCCIYIELISIWVYLAQFQPSTQFAYIRELLYIESIHVVYLGGISSL